MTVALDPQTRAADPRRSTWVSANAGSGKTSTLVKRVARLLLAGAPPERILCVTFTKAAAAEMQRRVFDQLGRWAVMDDPSLQEALAQIDEAGRGLPLARRLFAQALETPGGLKIETLHAFCEKLLRRFPLEAGVSPRFRVLDGGEARAISRQARASLAAAAETQPDGPLARAYAHFSVYLGFDDFDRLLDDFEANHRQLTRFVFDHGEERAWRRCGFATAGDSEAIASQAVRRIRWGQWAAAVKALADSGKVSDRATAANMADIGPESRFEDLATIFCLGNGERRKSMATLSIGQKVRDWLGEEQARVVAAAEQVRAARIAEATCHALVLAVAYGELYEGAKDARGGLDFDDLIERSLSLLTERADAAWVLYKLDGGIDHLLLDEAQDTSPAQWDVVRALTAEFFADTGAGATARTVFAVADEKQSIFSFQGAAPERFAAERNHFAPLIRQRGEALVSIPLQTSFRSAPEILDFVDQVFADKEAAAGLRPRGESIAALIKHQARRPAGGAVELWPLEAGGEDPEPDLWAPVDAEPKESKNRRLARRVARTIRAMVARGEDVGGGDEEPRPCAWRDFLILVRRRGPLFFEIIRELKAQGVPVGGADRLRLSEHGVFADLVALAWFVQFPADDLTLASLLRGPFCEVGEESLFDLASARTGSLWGALRARAKERPEWTSAATFLAWSIGGGRTRTPFDFYSHVLSRLDEGGLSLRSRLLTRMGVEGEDALDAFMAEALAAEGRGARDLESFAAAMADSEIEVKREADETYSRPGGEVRVMTVHGAKGLEAPIVILPDTSTRAQPLGVGLVDDGEDGWLWPPRKDDDCEASRKAKDIERQACERESSRLLYVALTRARDRLIIAGVESPRNLFERSWYDFIARAFAAPALAAAPMEREPGYPISLIGSPPASAAGRDGEEPAQALPPWVRRLAAAESERPRTYSPSRLGAEAGDPALSPLAKTDGLGRWRRGDLIHRLLQILPDLPAEGRPAAAALLLEREGDLTGEQRAEMAAAALAVMADRRFASVFGPGSRAEAAIAGGAARLGARRISGRMDRLVVEPERVLVVDFKTNRPAPASIAEADGAYIRQMAAYCAVLGETFPGRRIEAALLWTDGPKLMAVPENMIDQALDEIAASG